VHQEPKRMDPEAVLQQTRTQLGRKADYLHRAQYLDVDAVQFDRWREQLCPICFYLPVRIAGQAMTERPCGICGRFVMYGNTATDVLCPECAQRHELCKRCGADIDLRHNRKLEPWPIDASLGPAEKPAPEPKPPTVMILPNRRGGIYTT
jgi:hypothetical protein